MDGNRMRLEKVVSPEPAEPEAAEEGPADEEVPEPEREEGPAKIISLTDRKKS
jgi:hypothetical protein